MYFNQKIVKPGFKKDGISFSTLGINMIVEIPEIGATITFSGLIFSVKLPYSKFGNNTEGQCGKIDALIGGGTLFPPYRGYSHPLWLYSLMIDRNF